MRTSDRLRALLLRIREPSSLVMRNIALLVAVAVFLAGGMLALRSLDLEADTIRWLPLIVVAVLGIPATALHNAAEYWLSAALLGHRIPAVDAASVSILSTAANLLPIPGAAAVRIASLNRLGAGLGSATLITVLIGGTWLGISLVAASFFLVPDPAGLAFLVGGLTAIGVAAIFLARAPISASERRRMGIAVVAVEAGFVAIGAARLGLVLYAVGFGGSVTEGLVLNLSGAMSATVGVFPGGLGIRELIAAGLAPLVDLPSAVGFAAAGLNRVIGILVHVPIGFMVWRAHRVEAE